MSHATLERADRAQIDAVSASIPIDHILVRNYRQARFDDEQKLAELAASIAEEGLLQEIRVYEASAEFQPTCKRKYVLGFGERRLRAHQMLDRTHIRAVIFPPAPDAAIEAARAIENLHREDPTAIEFAMAVRSCLELYHSPAFLATHAASAETDPYHWAAAHLGKSVAWVKDHDYLHRLTGPVRDLAARTRLPAGHLRLIAKVGDPELQADIAWQTVNGSTYVVGQSWRKPAFDPAADGLPDPPTGDLAKLLANYDEGSARVLTLDDVKRLVAQSHRSLARVPWECDVPLTYGTGKKAVDLPACSGCPHNSETDRTLFGIDPDPKNPRGVCLNAGCFAAKTEAAEQVKVQLATKLAKRKNPPTPTEIKDAAPAWIKDSTIVGYVKRQITPPRKSEPNTSKPVANYEHNPARNSPLEKARAKFKAAYYNWEADSDAAIEKRVQADPVMWTSLLVLWHTQAWDEATDYHAENGWDNINWSGYGPQPPAPVLLTTGIDELEALIEIAGRCTFESIQELACQPIAKHQPCFDEMNIHPNLIQALAVAFAVNIDLPPHWNDFAPAPAPAPGSAPAPAPGSDAKPAKKKTTKKKTTKSKKGATT